MALLYVLIIAVIIIIIFRGCPGLISNIIISDVPYLLVTITRNRRRLISPCADHFSREIPLVKQVGK